MGDFLVSFLPGPLARPLPHLNYSSPVARCSCDHLSGGWILVATDSFQRIPVERGALVQRERAGGGSPNQGAYFQLHVELPCCCAPRRLLPAWALGSGHPPTAPVLLRWNCQRSIGRWRIGSHRAWRDSAFRLPGSRMGWGQLFLVGIWV